MKGTEKTEGTAAGVYDLRLLRNNPCTSSIKGLMQGLPVAHLGAEEIMKGRRLRGAPSLLMGSSFPGRRPGTRLPNKNVPLFEPPGM